METYFLIFFKYNLMLAEWWSVREKRGKEKITVSITKKFLFFSLMSEYFMSITN